MEARRLPAAWLLKPGLSQADVAREVGVHRQSVTRWAQPLESGGRAALKKAGRAGRKPRLRAADLRRIEGGLVNAARLGPTVVSVGESGPSERQPGPAHRRAQTLRMP